MRKWLAVWMLLGWLAFPSRGGAQAEIWLPSLQVELWPEYDQPAMLVIYEFTLPPESRLPLEVAFRIPQDANLIAVAAQTPQGNLVNAEYSGPSREGEWQRFAIKVEAQTTYHFEYYESLPKSGARRQFAYVWPGDYAVEDFRLLLRLPLDITEIVTDPPLGRAGGGDVLERGFGRLPQGQPLTFTLNYTRSNDRLAIPLQNVQPSEPLTRSTAGRVTWSDYFPFVLGGLGVLLILGGLAYFWQANRAGRPAKHRRRSPKAAPEPQSHVYCHQCGTRAQRGDRFCRLCGTRLRADE